MTDNSETNLRKLDKTELERTLLVEQILEQRRSSSWLERISGIGALASSVGALVAALVALLIANSNSAIQIVEAHEKKAELYQSKEELTQINTELKQRKAELQDSKAQTASLAKQTDLLKKTFNALRDANPSKPVHGVDIAISTKGSSYFIDVTTAPADAKAKAFFECDSDFGFPAPDSSTKSFTELAYDAQNTPCQLGPFLKMRQHVWIVVDFGTHKEVRFVNLSGN